MYETGPHPYSLPITMGPIKKLEAFSTNVDTMNTTNSDEEWDMSKYNSRETNKVRSTTFSHSDKITITDGNTGHVISEISLHTTDNVPIYNIGSKTPCSPPFPNINKDELVNKEQLEISSVTTKLKDMIIYTPMSKEDSFDKRLLETRKITTNDQAITLGAQPSTCTLPLPSLAYKDPPPPKGQ